MQGQGYTKYETTVAACCSRPFQDTARFCLPEGVPLWHVLQAMLRNALHPAYRFQQGPKEALLWYASSLAPPTAA